MKEREEDMTNNTEILAKHKKLRAAIRYYLHGRDFNVALKAMNFAEDYHDGTRKDGITPEFDHQVRIAHYVRTLPNLLYPEETIATVFLHDVPEDYDVNHEEIARLFGNVISVPTELVTKTLGYVTNPYDYYEGVASNPISSIVKGGDRVHNVQSMIDVFDKHKQIDYMAEVREFFLPMIKTAKRNFPEQEAAYENIKHMLESHPPSKSSISSQNISMTNRLINNLLNTDTSPPTSASTHVWGGQTFSRRSGTSTLPLAPRGAWASAHRFRPQGLRGH